MLLNDFRQRMGSLLRLALVAAMVLCLTFTAQRTLSFLATSTEGVQSSIRIQVREAEPETPLSGSPELRLNDLAVDGRRLRFESTERSPHWAATERHLLYKGDPREHESVNFTGESF